jgi:hypothetical protein
VTVWAAPDQDAMRRIIFQLQHPSWHLYGSTSSDRQWQAINGSTRLTADSLAAVLDQLDWIHAT